MVGLELPMPQASSYFPVLALTRGATIESVHYGAIAVVDVSGRLIAWYGDPQAVTFMRSSAKPFQALPFVENGGQEAFDLSLQQIAILCASHSGTDEHVSVVQSIQAKVGLRESDLLCGVHEPADAPTAQRLREQKEEPTPNRHNCSGKHTGMLSFARLLARMGLPIPDGLPYIDPAHPLQQMILRTFSDMCGLPIEQISLGTDGCSAPNFAIPLYHAALGFARLCDPEAGGVQPAARQAACRTITAAMMSHPLMVGGPGRFDTCLMQVAHERMVVKGGAEGYQGIGLMPGALGPGSPAVGVAFKIADGDERRLARAAVALEVLRQLGALTMSDLQELASFGPVLPRYNGRKLTIGEAYPAFRLNRAG
jgi:L-asparaginase II